MPMRSKSRIKRPSGERRNAYMRIEASEILREIEGEIMDTLEFERFRDEDEVREFIIAWISHYLQDEDNFNRVLEEYADRGDLENLFVEDFTNDVMNYIGDLSYWVSEEGMDYDAKKRMRKDCSVVDHISTNEYDDANTISFMDDDSGVEFDVYFEPDYDSDGVAEYSYELSMKTDPEDMTDMSWETIERGDYGEYDFDPENIDESEIGEYFFEKIPQDMIDKYSDLLKTVSGGCDRHMAKKRSMKTVVAANPTVSRFVKSVEDEMWDVYLENTDAVKNYIEMRAEDFLSSKENFSDEVWERIEWDAVLGRDILETFTQKALNEIDLFSWVDDDDEW